MNFDSPYRSASVTEFWKRWHITLTTFLRECLYFPLGGSRRGTARTYWNILIIFLVSGLWHGAGWTFLVWGALHGLAQILERAWGKRRDRLPCCCGGADLPVHQTSPGFFRAPERAGALELLGRAVTGGLARPEPWLLEDLLAQESDAVQMTVPGCGCLLVGYPAGAPAVWGGDDRRPLAPERDPPDGGLLPHPLAGRGGDSADGVVCAVLHGVTTFIYSNF